VDTVGKLPTESTGIETGSKKERVMAELRSDPSRSGRVIARAAGASHGFGPPQGGDDDRASVRKTPATFFDRLRDGLRDARDA
jgi:hypothetical protein